jgi:hypothetical protein
MTAVARSPGEMLAQHLTTCPSCGHPAAAHVALERGEPVLVRLVCASGCPDNDTARVAVIDALYGAPAA